MRCLSCQYDLSHLTPTEEGGHRCPECGRAFDPNDTTTFDTSWTLRKRVLWQRAGHILLLCLGTYLLAFAISFYQVSTDTTYIPDTNGSSSEWALSFQLFASLYRAAGTCFLWIPFPAVLYLLLTRINKPNES